MADNRYEIDDFAFIGRTFEEYCRMFDLDPDELDGERILDCPGGACSFVAEANDRGIPAVGADVLYGRDPGRLAERGAEDIEKAMEALSGVEHLYNWTFYEDVHELESYRRRACERFVEDYASHRDDRYVHAELPDLPFEDGAFSLVLSAHFLFLYDDRLDHEFHVEAIRELLRVSAGELRLFPLVGFDAETYARLDDIVDAFDDEYAIEIARVPFGFQNGADELLVVSGIR